MDVETHCSILYSSLCHLLLNSSNTVLVSVSFVLEFDFELFVQFPWVSKISLQKPSLTFELFLLIILSGWCGRSSDILGYLSFVIYMSNKLLLRGAVTNHSNTPQNIPSKYFYTHQSYFVFSPHSPLHNHSWCNSCYIIINQVIMSCHVEEVFIHNCAWQPVYF
jgi:hypothetical protein